MGGNIRKYRVGIIGCGLIASGFEDDPLREHPCTHAGAYSAISQTEIVAAADINKKRLKVFSKKWGVNAIYLDYEKMLRSENLDIVSICTNTPSHSEITVKTAESGIEAIFCEKPIATSLEGADEMIKVCKKYGTKLFINHTRRWDNNYQKMREIIRNGYIGKLNVIVGQCPTGLANNGTHLFDMFRFFSGDIRWVFGNVNNDKIDPGGSGYLKFKNSAIGFFNAGIINEKNYLIFEIDALGLNGRMKISNNGRVLNLWKAEKSKHYSGIKELSLQKLPKIVKKNNMISAIRNIIGSIEHDTKIICSGEDGRAALEVALAIYESGKKGTKIKLPLKNKKLKITTSK